MKKIIISLVLLVIGATTYAQTYRALSGYDPVTGRAGYVYRDTLIALPYLPLYYVNGYGNVVNLGDTVRTLISLTTTGTSGAATYNSTTGVLNIPQYAGTTYTATTPITLTGSAFGMVNQGTTTTLLHGNASGNPSFSAVALAADVSGTLPVANGGTANTTFTAYSVLTAGTTSTGAFQNVSGVGTSGQVLTSNGASALPTWQAAAGGGWSLTGNSGTTAGTNFWGTTDNQPIIAKVNSVNAIKVDSVNATEGDVHIGFNSFTVTGHGNTTGGFKAGNKLTLTTGSFNTAWGNMALSVATNSLRNTAIGASALKGVGAGGASNDNTAVGHEALYIADGGSSQTAIGSMASHNATFGGSNVSVGFETMYNLTSGSSNTAVGNGALYSVQSSNNNTAIGKDAGRYYTGSNAMVSSNSEYLGYLTMALGQSQTNQTVIGYSAFGLGSNTTAIGNLTKTDIGLWGKLHSFTGTQPTLDTTAQLAVYNPSATVAKGFLPPTMTTTSRLRISSGVKTGTLVGGSGYTNGTYTANALTGGTGTNATATIVVSGGAIISVTMVDRGYNYVVGDVLGGTGLGGGTGFTFTVATLTATTEGLTVYDLTTHKMYTWDATAWQAHW